jgi:DNA repair exonuclease SbcCD ATPase subunit
MTFPPFYTAAGEPGAPYELYVIVAGLVCTALGWLLHGWYSKQRRSSPSPEPVQEALPESAAAVTGQGSDEAALSGERGKIAAQLASMETALAGAEAARHDALRELETLRPKAASHDEAHERARQLESSHRKALEDMIAAESALKAARLSEGEAHARATAAEGKAGVDPQEVAALDRQLTETRSLEAAAREAAARALEECEAATELNTRLHRELGEARTAAEEARAAAAEAESRSAQLVRDLDEARSRIAAFESTPEVPLRTEVLTNELQSELERTRQETATAREELAAATAEVQKLKSELSGVAGSEESHTAQLARDIEEARRRIAELESHSSVPVHAETTNSSGDELAEARRATEAAREELRAASEELRKLKSELSARKPRPILTSPRPDGGAPAGQP